MSGREVCLLSVLYVGSCASWFNKGWRLMCVGNPEWGQRRTRTGRSASGSLVWGWRRWSLGWCKGCFPVRYTVSVSMNFRGTLKQIPVHSCVAVNGQRWVLSHFTELPELTWLCSSKDFLLLLASLSPQASHSFLVSA